MKAVIVPILGIVLFLGLISAAFRWKHIRYFYQVHTLHGRQLEPAPIHYASWPQYARTNFQTTDVVSKAMKERHRKDIFRVDP